METGPKSRIIKFAGVNSHEPLQLGRHITIRVMEPPMSLMEVGERVRLIDVNDPTNQAAAEITDLAHGFTYATIRGLDRNVLGLERSNLRNPNDLADALQEFYPDSTDSTTFMAIEYVVYLKAVI